MSAKTLHQIQQEGLKYWLRSLALMMQSGSSRSMRREVATGQQPDYADVDCPVSNPISDRL